MIRDAQDRRAIALAALASLFLLAALVLPITWVVVLLTLAGLLVGSVAVATGLRRLPSRRA